MLQLGVSQEISIALIQKLEIIADVVYYIPVHKLVIKVFNGAGCKSMCYITGHADVVNPPNGREGGVVVSFNRNLHHI